MSNQRLCPSCATPVAANERFCGNCGTRMPEAPPPPAPDSPTLPVGRAAAAPTVILPPEPDQATPPPADAPTQVLNPPADAPTQVLNPPADAPASPYGLPTPPTPPPATPLNLPSDTPSEPAQKRRLPLWLMIVLGVVGLFTLICVGGFALIVLYLTPQSVEISTAASSVAVTAGPGGIADLGTIPAAGGANPSPTPDEPQPTPAAAPTAENSAGGGIVGGALGGNTSGGNTAATAAAATEVALAQEQAAAATAEIEQLYAGSSQVFYDEFVDNRNRWFTGVFQEIETDVIEDGVFKVIWAGEGSSYELYEVRELTNFITSVDCLIAAGGVDGSCGLVFGQRNDVGFYKYELFEDYYRLFIVRLTGEPELLTEGDPAGIVRPAETNNLRVIKQGDEIRLYLNNTLLDVVFDATFPTGKIGVSTNSYTPEAGVEIWFDNFGVWALGE